MRASESQRSDGVIHIQRMRMDYFVNERQKVSNIILALRYEMRALLVRSSSDMETRVKMHTVARSNARLTGSLDNTRRLAAMDLRRRVAHPLVHPANAPSISASPYTSRRGPLRDNHATAGVCRLLQRRYCRA
jgi:hypothetical protein